MSCTIGSLPNQWQNPTNCSVLPDVPNSSGTHEALSSDTRQILLAVPCGVTCGLFSITSAYDNSTPRRSCSGSEMATSGEMSRPLSTYPYICSNQNPDVCALSPAVYHSGRSALQVLPLHPNDHQPFAAGTRFTPMVGTAIKWCSTHGIERRANDCDVEWFHVLAIGSQTMYVGQICVCHQPCELARGDVRIVRSLKNDLLR
jgi:hypothetical protein